MQGNKGESLLESLISMFFITVVLSSLSNLMLKTFNANNKVSRKNIQNFEDENIIELIKTKKYSFMKNLNGIYNIPNKEQFYNFFDIDEKYRNLTLNQSKKIEIKNTGFFYINEEGEKEYILEIDVEGKKDYYFPEMEWEI